jgi:hypothetical protein
MTLKIHLSEPVHRCGCDRCGLTDPEGGVLLEDNTEARRVFCRACTMELLVACLTRTRSIAPASHRRASIDPERMLLLGVHFQD